MLRGYLNYTLNTSPDILVGTSTPNCHRLHPRWFLNRFNNGTRKFKLELKFLIGKKLCLLKGKKSSWMSGFQRKSSVKIFQATFAFHTSCRATLDIKADSKK